SSSSSTPRRTRGDMARLVVKLGSSVVAQPDGRVRGDVVAHVCDVVAARRAAGDQVVVVCSGAIARGVRLLGLPARPTAGADQLVLLTDIDGLFTADPRHDPRAELVVEVADVAQLAGVAVGEGTSALGSGGMRSKLVAAQMATSAGIPTVIGNGVVNGVLE